MNRIIVPNHILQKSVQMQTGMQGFMRFQTINKFSGKITSDTGFFPNTILNSGKNEMGQRTSWMDWCQVGTDGTLGATLAERQAETSLRGWFAGTSTIVETTNGQSVSPYYGWKRRKYRFGVGTVAANLSEAGIGWGVGGAGNPDALISRAQILDPILETPTTVTPLPDELLDVTYELRYYPPLVDVLGPQVMLYDTTYDTISRAASAGGNAWSDSIGTQMGVGHIDWWTAYDGTIGAISTGPNGVSAGINDGAGSTVYNSAYSNNSYQIEMHANVVSLGWNLGAGIRSMRIRTSAGDYQTQFDANPGGATIPKSSIYTMNVAWTLSWAEYIAPWEIGLTPYALGDRTSHNGFYWESDINNNNDEPGVANWTLY